MSLVFITNWTTIQGNLTNWSMQGYVTVLGPWVWPVIFSFIIGYVFLKQQSYTAAAIAILLFFGAFGNVLLDVDIWVNLMSLFVFLIITALILVFLTKVRR